MIDDLNSVIIIILNYQLKSRHGYLLLSENPLFPTRATQNIHLYLTFLIISNNNVSKLLTNDWLFRSRQQAKH